MSKNGLPKIIFNKISKIINKELSELFEGLDFKIYFDSNNILKMADLSTKQKTEREIYEGSGMERTFSILAIKNIFNKYNTNFKLNYIVLDEITGKLDEENKIRMVELINKLKDIYEIIFLIDQEILDYNKLLPKVTIKLEKTEEGTLVLPDDSLE